MKYGLLTYKYTSREGYRPSEVNIGDYIQAIAARQFLPRVDVLVDRDSVSSYSGDPVRLIMNGWWHVYEGNATTSAAITPLYVSYHIANPEGLTKEALEHLQKYSPIGCRDIATVNCLLNNGIEAYLSSCLTSTLGKTYRVPEEKRTNIVYFVDCDFIDFEKPSWIKWCLSRKARRSCSFPMRQLKQRTLEIIEDYLHDAHVEKRSHMYPLTLDDNERFQIADQLLRDYSRARLIVTSRLHCALPAFSMGIPVLFVGKNLQDCRYDGTLDWVNRIGFDEEQNIVQYLFTNGAYRLSPSLPTKLTTVYASQLSLQCQQFIQ